MLANIIHLLPRALAAIPLPPSSRVACSICGIDWEMRRNIAFSIVKTVTYFGAFILPSFGLCPLGRRVEQRLCHQKYGFKLDSYVTCADQPGGKKVVLQGEFTLDDKGLIWR
jgi:hypothetical protein